MIPLILCVLPCLLRSSWDLPIISVIEFVLGQSSFSASCPVDNRSPSSARLGCSRCSPSARPHSGTARRAHCGRCCALAVLWLYQVITATRRDLELTLTPPVEAGAVGVVCGSACRRRPRSSPRWSYLRCTRRRREGLRPMVRSVRLQLVTVVSLGLMWRQDTLTDEQGLSIFSWSMVGVGLSLVASVTFNSDRPGPRSAVALPRRAAPDQAAHRAVRRPQLRTRRLGDRWRDARRRRRPAAHPGDRALRPPGRRPRPGGLEHRPRPGRCGRVREGRDRRLGSW